MSGIATGTALAIGLGSAGAVGSGLIAAHGASSAANAQSHAAMDAAQLEHDSAQQALDFQKQQYGQSYNNIFPYLQTGTSGLANLAYLLGLPIPGFPGVGGQPGANLMQPGGSPPQNTLGIRGAGTPPQPTFWPGQAGQQPPQIGKPGQPIQGIPGGAPGVSGQNPGIQGIPGGAPGIYGQRPGAPGIPGGAPGVYGQNGPTNDPNATNGVIPKPYSLPPGINDIKARGEGIPGGRPGIFGQGGNDQGGTPAPPDPAGTTLTLSNGQTITLPQVPPEGSLVNTNLGTFGSLLAPWTQQFDAPTDVTEQNDPGYKFRQQQGEKAIQQSAAANGNLLTGGTAKALSRYGQDYASNEYGNVYNRALQQYQQNYNIFQNNQSNVFNRLAAIAGIGQVGAGQLNSAGQNASSNIGNILLGSAGQIGQQYNNAAAARGSGYVGVGNALGGAVGGLGSSLTNAFLLNNILGQSGGSGANTGSPIF